MQFCLGKFTLLLPPVPLVSYIRQQQVCLKGTEDLYPNFPSTCICKTVFEQTLSKFIYFFQFSCLSFFFIVSATAGSATARCHQSLQIIKTRPALTLGSEEGWCLSSHRTQREWETDLARSWNFNEIIAQLADIRTFFFLCSLVAIHFLKQLFVWLCTQLAGCV